MNQREYPLEGESVKRRIEGPGHHIESYHRTHLAILPLRDVVGGVAGFAASSWILGTSAANAQATTSPSTVVAPAAASLCDDAISHLRDPATGKEIYLIGTAHISNVSAQV